MSSTLAPSVTDRDPKGQKFISLVIAAYNKAALAEDEAQLVNEAPGLPGIIAKFIEENRRGNKYADEQTRTVRDYPSGYGIVPIEEQVKILVQIFPHLDASATFTYIKEIVPTLTLPPGAEGWFAIPRWRKIARNYNSALEVVLTKLGQTRPFHNYREGALSPSHLRQSARTLELLRRVESAQPGDILIIPGQFGAIHAGQSVRRAREVMRSFEYGFGAFAVGSLLLTHPGREEVWEQLHIDCAGDEYSPDADGQFDYAPYFHFNDGKLKFGTSWVNCAHGYFGSASGFLPQ